MSKRLRRMARVPVYISAGGGVLMAAGAAVFFTIDWPIAGWVWAACVPWHIYKTVQTVRWYRRFVRETEARMAEARRRRDERAAELEQWKAEQRRKRDEHMRRLHSPWN